MSTCLFCDIVAGREPAWRIWEDERHLAFLTPFPNTPGFAVVIPKDHLDSDVLALDDEPYTGLMLAARSVGRVLTRALSTVRTGLIVEGMGVNHAHVKLAPLHGIPRGPWQPVRSAVRQFYDTYQGFIASHDGPRASDEELTLMAERIREAVHREGAPREESSKRASSASMS